MAGRAADAMTLLGVAAWHPDSWPDLTAVGHLLQDLQTVASGFAGSLDRVLDRVHETRPGEDVASAIARAHLGSIVLLAAHHAAALSSLLHTATSTARTVTTGR